MTFLRAAFPSSLGFFIVGFFELLIHTQNFVVFFKKTVFSSPLFSGLFSLLFPYHRLSSPTQRCVLISSFLTPPGSSPMAPFSPNPPYFFCFPSRQVLVLNSSLRPSTFSPKAIPRHCMLSFFSHFASLSYLAVLIQGLFFTPPQPFHNWGGLCPVTPLFVFPFEGSADLFSVK